MTTVPSSDPVSHLISGAAATAVTWSCPARAAELTFVNRGTADAWVTVNGPAATVSGDNEILVPSTGEPVSVQVEDLDQAEDPSSYTGPVVSAISSATLSLYAEAR